jgi:putative peptidoglycan lipid II flippase
MWRQVASVGGLTLLSRLFGFVRDVLMAAMLGAGPMADAFMVAFRLPNHFRTIFAEGAFNASFLPRYTAALTAEGDQAAAGFSGMVLVLTLICQALLLVLALCFTPVLVSLLAPGFADEPGKFALTVELTRITFPYLAFIAVMTLVGGMLNARGRFAAVASAPILLNICMIAALFAGTCFPTIAHALAWGVVMSGLAQLLWVWGDLLRSGGHLSFALPRFSSDMRAFLRAFGPATLGAAGFQIAMFADTIIASFLAAGSVSYLYYAERLYQLPLAIFGIAIGTVLLPALSARFAVNDFAGARDRLNRALEGTLLLTLPCVVGFLLASEAIMAVLFERGAFNALAVAGSARALEAYAVGLLAVVFLRVVTPAFHARGDTSTPVIALFTAMVVNIALKIVLMGPLAHAGLALATSIGAWVNIMILTVLLRKRGDFAPDALLFKRFAVIIAGAIAMALVLEGLKPFAVPLDGIVPAHPQMISLLARGTASLAVYGGLVLLGWKLVRR